jgi:hypothetical protein
LRIHRCDRQVLLLGRTATAIDDRAALSVEGDPVDGHDDPLMACPSDEERVAGLSLLQGIRERLPLSPRTDFTTFIGKGWAAEREDEQQQQCSQDLHRDLLCWELAPQSGSGRRFVSPHVLGRAGRVHPWGHGLSSSHR